LRPKPCKIRRNFTRLQTSTTNISDKDGDIKIGKLYDVSNAVPPAFGEKSPVNFGPQTIKIGM